MTANEPGEGASDGDPDEQPGGASADQSVDGQSVEGQSTNGQSTAGQSAAGQPTGGQSASGESTSGQSTGGQSGGQSSGHAGGQSSGGQSPGQPVDDQSPGQPAGGQSPGQPAGGQSPGQPAGGQSGGQSPGQPTGGQSPGQPAGGQSITGPAAGSGTGLEPNVAAAIAYVFAPLTGVVMLLLEGEDDDYVRFHSIQSIGFGVAAFAAYVVVGMFVGIVTAIPFIGNFLGFLAIPMYGIVGLVAFVGWALLILKAHQGERYGLPVIGPIAAKN